MTVENQNALIDEIHALNINLMELIKVLKEKNKWFNWGPSAPKKYFLYLYNYNESRLKYSMKGECHMGEIVIIPVPAGDTIICDW